MSAYLRGSEVPPLVFTFVFMEGYCILGIQFGPHYFLNEHFDTLLTVRALNPCQDRSSEAKEQGRASGDKIRQTALTHLVSQSSIH